MQKKKMRLKRTASGIALTLLLTNILFLAINIQPARANGTIYIRTDGSINPPTAPLKRNGNVYTLTGNIISDADGIVVERDNIVINGAHFTVEGALALPSHGIYLYGRNNVTIQNTNIRQFGDGIWLNSSSNNSISGNNIASTDVGINLDSSSNNIIGENSIETNDWCNIRLAGSSSNNIWGNSITESNENGIFFHFSSNNSINGNNIANNRYSINFYSSSGNSITANNITANNDGMTITSQSKNTISGNMFVHDGVLVGGPGNVVTGNKVNGKPLVYLEDVSDYIVEDAGQVILVNCNRIRVESLNLSNTTVGIELLQTNNTLISRNTMTNNNYGIIISYSSNDSISGNIVALNQYANIFLENSSSNMISKNYIGGLEAPQGNYMSSVGIAATSSSNNTIAQNNLTLCFCAIRFEGRSFLGEDASNNNITENNIQNSQSGVNIGNSSNNTLMRNNITWVPRGMTGSIGIDLYVSFFNMIAQNSITRNEKGVKLTDSGLNTITQNDVKYNDFGIQLFGANNIISHNDIEGNFAGIYIESPYEYPVNTIYHNDFVHNERQVWDQTSDLNYTWDDGYPYGGNYWSDYNGTDADGDGIGEEPYFIDEKNMDRYPIVSALDSDFLVHNLGSGLGYSTIQQAIDAAETENGHIIAVDEGTYYEHVALDKAIYLAGERRKAIIDGSGNGTVLHVLANNTLISGFTIRESGEKFDDEPAIWCGVEVGEYEFPIVNTTIIKNAIESNYIGIFLWFSFNGTVVDNNIQNSTQGVVFENCMWNNIANNIVSRNVVGMNINDALENTISGNNIVSNIAVGLYFDSCQNNIINENYIGNSNCGIALDESSDNEFLCNSFINNSRQIETSPSDYTNAWNNGSQGNYWSDHNPLDENKDKIGDIPYIIDENNTDRYPLIYPFECYEPGYVCSPDLNKDGVVNIIDISKVARAFNCIPGDIDWSAIADIDLNEVINILDISKVAKEFGKEWAW